MKSIKKVLAVAFAGALAFTMAVPVQVQAAVDASTLADGTAYLSINNADWGDYEAEVVTANVTGDGQYTVSVTPAEAQDLAQFNALQIKNGEQVFGHEYIVTVDSIKINGAAVSLQGSSYTCSADGAGVDTRVNIYNEWNSPTFETSDSLGYVDDRSNDQAGATAKLIGDEYLTGLESIEVTFTVSGLGGAASDDASEETASDDAAVTTTVAKTADVTPFAGIMLAIVAAALIVVAIKRREALN